MLLKPYHKFEDGHGTCIINIEEMTTYRIEEATSGMIDSLSANPNFPIPGGIEEQLKKFKLLSDEARPSRKEGLTEPLAIHNIALFVTQQCNFRCVYCYGDGGGYGSEGKMNRKTAYRAIDWLIEQSGKSKKLGITFFGGEPLLNFTLIKDVVAYAKERGKETEKEFGFTISTNGSLLDEDKIAFIKEQKMHVNVGFDGPKGVQDVQRPFKNGKGSYDVTVKNIKRLLAVLPDIASRATLLSGADPAGVEKALRALGFSRVAVEAASPSLFEEENNTLNLETVFLQMQQMEEAEAEDFLRNIKDRQKEKLKKMQHGSYTVVGKSLANFINNTKKYFFCGAGRRYVAVSTAGDVYLCHRFVGTKKYRLGNIFTKGLNNRKIYQKSSCRSVDKCSNCFARYICAGGCYYDNLAVGGTVFTPNELRCRMMRRSVELLASLTCRLSRADKDYLIDEEIIPRKLCVFDF